METASAINQIPHLEYMVEHIVHCWRKNRYRIAMLEKMEVQKKSSSPTISIPKRMDVLKFCMDAVQESDNALFFLLDRYRLEKLLQRGHILPATLLNRNLTIRRSLE